MLVVLSPASILHQIVLVFMLGGILASAVFTHSPRFEVFLSFTLSTIAAVIASCLISDAALAGAMAAMVVILAAAMSDAAARVHGTIDDGRGFALPQLRGSSGGVNNIRLRARMIGANLDLASEPMQGTVVTMEMPLST
jgi:signal transduction histidine kinase